jgi:glyoxylase I family protein
MATISGFHHTAIRSTNFDAVQAFYTEALGLKLKITWGEAPKRGMMLDAGDGNYVEVFERTESASELESALMHFALRTDDVVAMTEKARAAGAEITMEPKEITIDSSAGPIPVKISFFKGPAGEVVELFENAVL